MSRKTDYAIKVGKDSLFFRVFFLSLFCVLQRAKGKGQKKPPGRGFCQTGWMFFAIVAADAYARAAVMIAME